MGYKKVFYDKDRILEDSNALLVAQALHMQVVKKGKNHFIPCPGHLARKGHIDHNIGNAYLTQRGYYCSSCGEFVNNIKMVMEVENFSYSEALEFVADVNGGKEFYIDEARTQEANQWNESSDTDSVKAEAEMSRKRNQIKMITWQEQQLIGLAPCSYESQYFPIQVYFEKPKEETMLFSKFSGNTETWKKEWIVSDRSQGMSLAKLYNEDYEAYLWLVVEKCSGVLKILKEAEEPLSKSCHEFSVNLYYIFRKQRKEIEKILKKHQKALNKGEKLAS